MQRRFASLAWTDQMFKKILDESAVTRKWSKK